MWFFFGFGGWVGGWFEGWVEVVVVVVMGFFFALGIKMGWFGKNVLETTKRRQNRAESIENDFQYD